MPKDRFIVFTRPGLPLELREEPVVEPGPDEVLLRVSHAGICGTDAHRIDGDLPAPSVPVCLGHEGVGIVEALGAGISADRRGAPLAVGDRVYFAPTAVCGECEACRVHNFPMQCESLVWPVPAGGPNVAAFRDFATVPANAPFYRIPEGTSSESVIAFGCAMPTALGGFRLLGDVPQVVVVQGAGPVGLAATVLASLGGAEQVIVIGDAKRRLTVARRLGATATIPLAGTSVDERRQRVLELTGGRGAGAVIEAAGQPEAFTEGMELLGIRGRYLILGLFSGQAVSPVDPVRINNLSLSIIGSLGAPPGDYGRTIDLATEHGARLGFADLITHRFPLEHTEEAIRAAATGEPVKAVVMQGLI